MPKYQSLIWGAALAAIMTSSSALAETSYPSAAQSDPIAKGWMQGNPPSPEKMVRQRTGDITIFPKSRWAFSHMRELMPTRNIWRGNKPTAALPAKIDPGIEQIMFRPVGSDKNISWKQFLDASYTDAIVVLHKGRVVYRHHNEITPPETPHMLFSVTKSFTGLLAEMLIAEGSLDETAKVGDIVPELAKTGFGDASIRQLMDMTTGIDYTEVYTNPLSDIVRFSIALGLAPTAPGYTGARNSYDFLKTIEKKGEHGKKFTYLTTNTQALGWVISNISGQSVEAMLQDRFWSKMGMANNAYMTIDEAGIGFSGGGLNATLLDMARFGEMLRLNGKWNGQQIIPSAVIAKIRKGGDRDLFAGAKYETLPGWSYRSKWWLSHDKYDSFSARGVYGQALYVAPGAEMVIIRFASMPHASNTKNDALSLPAYHAMAEYLIQQSE